MHLAIFFIRLVGWSDLAPSHTHTVCTHIHRENNSGVWADRLKQYLGRIKSRIEKNFALRRKKGDELWKACSSQIVNQIELCADMSEEERHFLKQSPQCCWLTVAEEGGS